MPMGVPLRQRVSPICPIVGTEPGMVVRESAPAKCHPPAPGTPAQGVADATEKPLSPETLRWATGNARPASPNRWGCR